MNLQIMMKFLFRMGVKGVGLALYDKKNHGRILTWSTNYDLNKYTCRYMPLSFAYSHAMIQQNDRSKKWPLQKNHPKNDVKKCICLIFLSIVLCNCWIWLSIFFWNWWIGLTAIFLNCIIRLSNIFWNCIIRLSAIFRNWIIRQSIRCIIIIRNSIIIR